MGFNEQAKQGLMKEVGIKTKCGLRRARFWAKQFLETREREREELGLRRNQGFGGRSSPFLVSK